MAGLFRGSLSSLTLTAIVVTTLLISAGCDNRQGVKIGDKLPGFSGTDIAGEFTSLSQLKGKVVVLYFWTNSCCGNNLKQLESVYNRSKDKELAIVAVNEMDTKSDVERYAKENGITFTMLTDEKSMLLKQYQVFGLPTVFVVDRDGIIREKMLGGVETSKLEKLVLRQLDVPFKTPPAKGAP